MYERHADAGTGSTNSSRTATYGAQLGRPPKSVGLFLPRLASSIWYHVRNRFGCQGNCLGLKRCCGRLVKGNETNIRPDLFPW
jgi:hypothetical protein